MNRNISWLWFARSHWDSSSVLCSGCGVSIQAGLKSGSISTHDRAKDGDGAVLALASLGHLSISSDSCEPEELAVA
jgi:hypothetical protein